MMLLRWKNSGRYGKQSMGGKIFLTVLLFALGQDKIPQFTVQASPQEVIGNPPLGIIKPCI